ncbi:hypothetical protein Afil01_30890 [Actinorhabdospora filicis]|uniref:HTH luxR-type domain-containing protein n=1 Tax=Actinorhabdospora filicis TaxID=1785913 RepID=A0A9W6SLT7_9ACTN|nr:hypothetical protein [Actinorhabdospora filicis]GLZ78282.1 hypothetical protein Afil01_30890 [Actinorhabdospora filicis]
MSAAVSRLAGAYVAAQLAEGLYTGRTVGELAVLAAELHRHLIGAGIFYERPEDRVPVPAVVSWMSPRHVHLLTQVARGRQVASIAREQGRCSRSIERQLASIRRQLGVETTTAAVGMAVHLGLIRYQTPGTP